MRFPIFDELALSQAVNRRIGTPWSQTYDCYAFVRDIYGACGVDLPEYVITDSTNPKQTMLFIAHERRHRWQTIPEPHLGCLVLLAQRDRPHHCGIYVGDSWIAHNADRVGVVAHDRMRLQFTGWRMTDYLAYTGPQHANDHLHPESI